MTRLLAFSLFASAAFDWPLPWLDRAGTAALAFGFLALAVGSARMGVRRALPFTLTPKAATVADAAATADAAELGGYVEGRRAAADEEFGGLSDLAQRIAAYGDEP